MAQKTLGKHYRRGITILELYEMFPIKWFWSMLRRG